jgi:hypothetical protein
MTHLKETYDIDCHCEACTSNLEANFDFPGLQKLMGYMDEETKREGADRNWNLTLSINQEVLAMLRMIYNEYDQRITRQYARVSNMGILMLVPLPQLEPLIEPTREHLNITYGKDRPETIRFETKVMYYKAHEQFQELRFNLMGNIGNNQLKIEAVNINYPLIYAFFPFSNSA